MDSFDYVMVTSWSEHWDKPKAKSTLFRQSYIKKERLRTGPWPNECRTLFIKVEYGTNTVEKCWVGKSGNFRKDFYKDEKAVRFDVYDLKSIRCPKEYSAYPIGWHLSISAEKLEKAMTKEVKKAKNVSHVVSSVPPKDHFLEPPFFADMAKCDWANFELYCFYLLRLIGVNDIHKYPQDNNRGRADGFFKFKSLSVLYDATLESSFARAKETQLENYISQLKGDKMQIGEQAYTIRECTKQVWIITRGNEVKHLRTEDGIKVKEIPYHRLIDLYVKRLENEVSGEELSNKLKDLN